MRARTRILTAVAAAAGLAVTLGVTGPPSNATSTGHPSRPTRVLIVLFDQMVPQYADWYHMPNFRRLRSQGTYFKNAFLDYMASETVIAHNVITSGLVPKHMGWTDEAFRDTNNVFGKGAGKMHITGDFSRDDFATLEQHNGAPYKKLADYLHTAYPGTKFITVGEKSYAVDSATGSSGDIGVRLSSRESDVTSDYNPADPLGGGCRNLSIPGVPGNGQWRGPDGKNVPSYLTGHEPNHPKLCGRFFVNSDKANDYGTNADFPSWLYPEDGNRMFPGNDPKHLGGDVWAADAAIAMMKHENWSGMFVTLGGIDKAGHMWGAQADNGHPNCKTLAGMTHVPCAAAIADAQLGKLLDEVKKIDAQRGGHTMVVLTADHGATYGQHFYGKTTQGAGDSNWYYAPPDLGVFDAGSEAGPPDKETYSDPSEFVKNILDKDGHLQFSYQSTAIEAWLRAQYRTVAGKKDKAGDMLHMPGTIASYWKNGGHFELYGTNSMTTSEHRWWTAHAQQIVNTMAAPNGPDVIGLLHDRTSYGVYGDHGGAQRTVQRVPMVFWAPGMSPDRTGRTFHTPDVMPTILRALGITQTSPTDGVARNLG